PVLYTLSLHDALPIYDLDWPLLEEIVYSLDHRGYLEYPLDDIVKALNERNGGAAHHQYTPEEAQWALETIQSLEPKGVGARNLRSEEHTSELQSRENL